VYSVRFAQIRAGAAGGGDGGGGGGGGRGDAVARAEARVAASDRELFVGTDTEPGVVVKLSGVQWWTRAPTAAPTPAPPTPSPTPLVPTPRPTAAPTPLPTGRPTPPHSVSPTLAPTPAPTASPTPSPRAKFFKKHPGDKGPALARGPADGKKCEKPGMVYVPELGWCTACPAGKFAKAGACRAMSNAQMKEAATEAAKAVKAANAAEKAARASTPKPTRKPCPANKYLVRSMNFCNMCPRGKFSKVGWNWCCAKAKGAEHMGIGDLKKRCGYPY
jgi:hypothetical protein